MALGGILVFLLFFFIPITYCLSQKYRDTIEGEDDLFEVASKKFKKEDYKEQNPMSGEPGEIGKGLQSYSISNQAKQVSFGYDGKKTNQFQS